MSWGKKRKGGAAEAWDWGVDGFAEALRESLGPVAVLEASLSIDEMEQRLGQKVIKAAKTFNYDERLKNKSRVTQARVVVEEFVHKAMFSISSGFYDKPWLYKVNLTKPLYCSAKHTFGDTPLFTRVLAPAFERYVEEAIFTWAEDERINKGIEDVVEVLDVRDTHKKKAVNFLQKAFGEAHFKSPFGTHASEDPGVGMLMDFVKGWMAEFVNPGYTVLSMGIGNGAASKPEQINFLVVLFQTLISPERACLPRQLLSMITTPLPTPWPFLKDCAERIFTEYNSKPNKKDDVMQIGLMGAGPLIPQPLLGAGAFGRPF